MSLSKGVIVILGSEIIVPMWTYTQWRRCEEEMVSMLSTMMAEGTMSWRKEDAERAAKRSGMPLKYPALVLGHRKVSFSISKCKVDNHAFMC